MHSLRIFLSSPGDVTDERNLARKLIKEELPVEPFLRGRVHIDVVSWDDPAAPIPMDAGITPQEAVNQFGPMPSQCDVVVVILWSRLGTHLDLGAFRKRNRKRYLSGTEWEFEDALNAPQRPVILVYRRTEEPKVGARDPEWEEKFRQFRAVDEFFKRFKNADGSLQRTPTPYSTPTEFKELLGKHLRHLLSERLEGDKGGATAEIEPTWSGPPYPGLRSFTGEEAAIFFGRGREVDTLISRLRDPAQRFLAVVGASGSGKSSLVHAGLLPRLAGGATKSSQHWRMLTFTPGAVRARTHSQR